MRGPRMFWTNIAKRPPARNPREGVLQYIKKERPYSFVIFQGGGRVWTPCSPL